MALSNLLSSPENILILSWFIPLLFPPPWFVCQSVQFLFFFCSIWDHLYFLSYTLLLHRIKAAAVKPGTDRKITFGFPRSSTGLRRNPRLTLYGPKGQPGLAGSERDLQIQSVPHASMSRYAPAVSSNLVLSSIYRRLIAMRSLERSEAPTLTTNEKHAASFQLWQSVWHPVEGWGRSELQSRNEVKAYKCEANIF